MAEKEAPENEQEVVEVEQEATVISDKALPEAEAPVKEAVAKAQKLAEEAKEGEGYIPEALGDFDPRIVHTRDPKTGQMTKANPYRVIVDSNIKYYEHPKGSGNLWWENRSFAGRLGDNGRPVRGAKHMPFTPPLTMDEEISRQNMVLEQENKRLAKEVAEIKQEKELESIHPKADEDKGKGKKHNFFPGKGKAAKKSAKS
jgi:hypothetical protein